VIFVIGERIKDARIALGYSAEQVADFLKISPATVYRYENGDISKLPAKFIKPLADFLCVTPAYIMGWDNPDHYDKHVDSLLQYDVSDPSIDERDLIRSYRDLSPEGKEYIVQQLQIATKMFKEE
jgi:transcriptional regulator with XRE-family HTH domain